MWCQTSTIHAQQYNPPSKKPNFKLALIFEFNGGIHEGVEADLD